MKHSISIALALMIVLATISPVWANEPQGDLAHSSEEIKFRGTAIEYHEATMPGAPCYWVVEVEEVIFGPSISGKIQVITQQALPPPWGNVDPNISEGDRVEVFGLYAPLGDPNRVTLYGSADYYIVKVSTPIWPFKVYLPLVLKPPAPTPTPTPTPTSTPEPSLVEIVYESFEGDFPTGLWYTSQECKEGNYTWGPRNCKPHTGKKSAWCVGGGADGSKLKCGSDYPDEVKTQLIYGPFDLSDATAAKLTFWTWSSTQYESDTIYWGASTDGLWFWGERDSGSNAFWDYKEFDLSRVPEWGETTSYLGESEVWIMFSFESDEWYSREGWFIDDVRVVKEVGGSRISNEAPVSSNTKPGVLKRRIAY